MLWGAPLVREHSHAESDLQATGLRGTLNVGAVADVALLELREGNFEFLDNFGNKVPGRKRLFPSGTVLARKAVLGAKRIPRP